MKGIYVYSTNDADYKSNGEAKKVLAQVNAYKKAGVDLVFLDVILSRRVDKILYRLPCRGVYPKSFIEKCKHEAVDADFVYIRKNIFDCTFYSLLREIKTANSNIKILVEIPTYPYFREWNRLIDKPLIWKEKRVIPRVAKEHLVDYYLTLTDDKEIFGIPTISFDNCIDISDYKPKKNMQNPVEVHLIGVALLAFWHGYDRVIKGIRDYYQVVADNKTKVIFHIIGEGPEYKNYKRMVEQYKLEKYVIFEGKQKGEELDHLYDISNVGIGSLGLFRKGLTSSTSLKQREYCAKGIPFIKSGGDPAFDDYPYCISFSNDDAPIDITKIVNWAKKIDYNQAVVSMREYAARYLSWDRLVEDTLKAIERK